MSLFVQLTDLPFRGNGLMFTIGKQKKKSEMILGL